ncbi:S8 family serine peptidase [Glutamicibacter sp.]|uniref:S8 family peptidase n=1 Tax=Glutamicibacter sp. TaxID=1931995 RepID=UPI0028BDD139|nr:S8 family serine peptidase [Glutamicibacter sp.]
MMRAAVSFVLVTLLAFVFLLPSTAARADDMRDAEYWLKSLGIFEAQKETKGEGVKVAIIDTGIDTGHRDLKGAVVGGADMSGSGGAKGDRPIGVMSEHGTLVATLLGGRGNNQQEIDRIKSENQRLKSAWEQEKKTVEEANKDVEDEKDKKEVPEEPTYQDVPKLGKGKDGVLGVAPKADLLSVSLWMGEGNPSGISVEQQIPRAVKWAVDSGAKVINMSLGSTSPAWPESWDEAFKYAEDHDVVIVAAAGNRSGGMSQVGAPATIPGVLTVAGVDENGKASQDSSTEGISIGVAAPAEKLVGGLPGNGYARWSGTSGAAPLVAGVAALIRSKYPDMSANQVINRILKTAKDTGAPGADNLYGYGIIDANAAVNAPVPEVDENPLGTIAEWIHVHRRNADSSTESTDPGVSMEKSDLKQVAAPEPIAPDTSIPATQPVIVIGGAVLLLLVLVIGGIQIGRTARRQKLSASAASAKISDLKVGGSKRDRDIFDDIPEDDK